MGEADDDIQLNLVTTKQVQKKPNDKRKREENDVRDGTEKKSGQNTPLLKATPSKRLKLSKNSESDASPSDRPNNREKKFSSENIISSLFKSNPAIPQHVAKHQVTITEELFSKETFESLNIHPYMISNLKSSFYITSVTYVQKASIPSLLNGSDALVKSQTGSGKTLAYAIPMLQSLQSIRPKLQRSDGTYAVVIVPTRELAIQTYECFIKLAKSFTWIVPGYLMGGEKKKSEKSRLRKGVTILIATPGRLIDHVEHTSNLSLRKVKWLILDEADRLLDLGYEKDVSTFLTKLTEQQEGKRQTVMLSATLSPGVEKLAGLALHNPQIIDTAVTEDEDALGRLVVPAKLQQNFVVIPMKLRLVTLIAFIILKTKFSNERKLLVFMSTQDMVDFHAELFRSALNEKQDGDETNDDDDEDDVTKVDVSKLHGNMSQQDRTYVFKKFKDAMGGLLLCTDVAARGLDLPSVDWIIQYSAPSKPEDYVHRVGRTSRLGRPGSALLFLLPSEVTYVSMLEDRNMSIREMHMEDILKNLVATSRSNRKHHGVASVESAATDLQIQFEQSVLSDYSLKNLAIQAFLSFIRFYASYPVSVRHVFSYKSLHLGHLAKSLALRETPAKMGAHGRQKWRMENSVGGPKGKNSTRGNARSKPIGNQSTFDPMSEFASGL